MRYSYVVPIVEVMVLTEITQELEASGMNNLPLQWLQRGQRSLVGLATDVSVHVTKTARLLSSVHAICPVSIFKFTHDARNLYCLQKSGFMVCITPFHTNKHTHLYVQSFTYISSGLPQSFSESDSRKLSALFTEALMFRKLSIVVCSQIVASRAYGPGLWTWSWSLDCGLDSGLSNGLDSFDFQDQKSYGYTAKG